METIRLVTAQQLADGYLVRNPETGVIKRRDWNVKRILADGTAEVYEPIMIGQKPTRSPGL